jgi:toxin ParE1/3/4
MASSRTLVLSPSARNDLQDIRDYGLRQWGEARSRHYLTSIKELFRLLTRQPLAGPARPELLPGIRSLAVESHVVFYRVNIRTIEIIRVLHSRQDPHRL